ncbi:MAG TPA: SH3 domain-containing protein [Candidatus Limnocylindria bacterium]|nr:SH3 domain-containing protein [Candidatus Limnocylindria bacterium]
MKRKYLAILVAAAMTLTALGAVGAQDALDPAIEIESSIPLGEGEDGDTEQAALEEEPAAQPPAGEPEAPPAEEPIEEPAQESAPREEPAAQPPAGEPAAPPAGEPAAQPPAGEEPAPAPEEDAIPEEEPADAFLPDEDERDEADDPFIPDEPEAEEPTGEDPFIGITPEELEAGGPLVPIGTAGPDEIPIPDATDAPEEEPIPDAPEETPIPDATDAPAEIPVPGAPAVTPVPDDPEIILAPEETFAYIVPAGSLSIGSTRIELRAAPDPASAVLAVIDPGAYVRVLGEDAAWARVEYNGLVGYVDKANVVVNRPVFDPDSLGIRIWFTNEPEKVHYGDVLTMRGLLVGFEGLEYDYSLVWQRASMNRDRSVNNDWTDISGADGLTYTFTVDEATEWAAWRLIARVRVPAAHTDGQ